MRATAAPAVTRAKRRSASEPERAAGEHALAQLRRDL
jgi:hypothetical protein